MQGPRPSPNDLSRWIAGTPREVAAEARANGGLEQLLRLLWRRKQLVLAALVLGTLLAGLVVHTLPDRYRASSVLMFRGVPEATRVEAADGRDAAASRVTRLASEIEVMRSRDLLEAVVRAEELLFAPEFNPSLRAGRGLLERLGLAPPPMPADLRLSRQRARTVARLRERLGIHVLGRSRAVEIAVDSGDPERAARIANAVARVYLERRARAATSSHAATTAWLDRRVEALRRRVKAADAAVAEYRLSSGLVERGDAGANAQTLEELNSALLAARQARVDAQARLARAQAPSAGAAGPVSSDLIQSLRAQESELLRRRAELAIDYGHRHPRMRRVNAELVDLRREIAAEIETVRQGLRDEVAVARRREDGLRADLTAAKREAGRLRRAEVKLAQLEREASAERALFETFLARLKATAIAGDPPAPAAEVITTAEPPLAPSAPNRPLLLAFAVMASAVGGVGLAFAAEALDRGFRDLPQLERASGRPALALVPRLRARRDGTPAEAVLRRPHSAHAEAVRGLHTALLLQDVARRPRSVMLTSALPGEGKTALACALARGVARAGGRVLLVDADLRHSGVAEALGLTPGIGLAELLAGQIEADAAIRTDPRPETQGRLQVVGAGLGGDPAALLACPTLDTLLEALGRGYDLTVVDAPPVQAVADPRALATAVDRTVMVVRWARTPRRTTLRALKLLHETGATLAGSVLTQVDLRRHAQYGTGDAGGYAAGRGGYYVE